MIYKSENLIEDNINKLKSISQTSRFYCETNGNGNYVHNFSLPFELELLGHDAISENNTHYYYKLILLIDMVDIEYKVIHLLNYLLILVDINLHCHVINLLKIII